jgi:hypothetical protein
VIDPNIPASATPEELRQLIQGYNWDDGFALPRRIAGHPNCDLTVALELFWLANADIVFLGDTPESAHSAEWREFSQTLANKILDGRYGHGPSAYIPPLTKVQIHNLRKRGLPDVFLTGVSGVRA